MTDNERATAMADQIEAGGGLHWISRVFLETKASPLGDDNEALIVAALRAFSPPPADVREALAAAISETAVYGYEPGEGYQIRNPHDCADSALSILQSAGWGPRSPEISTGLPAPVYIDDETPAARDVLAERRVRHVKRETTYRVIGQATAQVSTGTVTSLDFKSRRFIADGDQITVYQAETDGKLYVRFTDEFEDGRFDEIERIDRAEKGDTQ